LRDAPAEPKKAVAPARAVGERVDFAKALLAIRSAQGRKKVSKKKPK
jgi:hypothetical protein